MKPLPLSFAHQYFPNEESHLAPSEREGMISRSYMQNSSLIDLREKQMQRTSGVTTSRVESEVMFEYASLL